MKRMEECKPDGTNTTTADCSFFDDLKPYDYDYQIGWLRDRAEVIRETYLDCVVCSHQIDSNENADIEDQMNNSSTKVTPFTLGQILNNQGCNYDTHIAFHIEPDDSIRIDTNSVYSETYCCYSRPLFYGLQKVHNLTSGTIFKFFVADLGGAIGETVVFKIENVTNAYFDYSKWPALVDAKNPL